MNKQIKVFHIGDLVVYKNRIYKVFCISPKYQYAQVEPYNHDYYNDILPNYVVYYKDIEPLSNSDVQLSLF